MQQLPLPELQQLQAKITKTIENRRERGKLLHNLINHPYLLQYNLVSVSASISDTTLVDLTEQPTENLVSSEKEETSKANAAEIVRPFKISMEIVNPESYVKAIHAPLEQVVNSLSRKEAAIIQNILWKGACQTQSEKSSLRRFMAKLPTENLLFLRELTHLPVAELQQLTAQTSKLPILSSESNGQEYQTEYPEETTEKKFVENAGLYLLAPYLPSVFARLNYLEKQHFKNSYVAARALQLTQYLVTGKRQNPEYLLVFNKLLCGIQLDVALAGGIRLTKKEIMEADNLLDSLIEHWQALKNTSPQGFRESFLQRKGILTENGARYTLQVERKGHDLLLNTIPWGFTLLKLPWMKKMLQVEW
ncbi:hypothetical protein HUW48_15420 [Adhaeribacter radiodurans]|uniref:Uncharacterized protein n=1 Tax=Adhaeribacter radiodurans TaxID=2745197 RepID=A0A7L7L945_9BACT|nr:hypothetical protein HUW48_15420 [Adhaeribacter radiodurans]